MNFPASVIMVVSYPLSRIRDSRLLNLLPVRYHFTGIILQCRKKKTTDYYFFLPVNVSEKNYIQANDDYRALMLETGDHAPVFSIEFRYKTNY